MKFDIQNEQDFKKPWVNSNEYLNVYVRLLSVLSKLLMAFVPFLHHVMSCVLNVIITINMNLCHFDDYSNITYL